MKPPKPPKVEPPSIRGATSPKSGRDKAASAERKEAPPAPVSPAAAPSTTATTPTTTPTGTVPTPAPEVFAGARAASDAPTSRRAPPIPPKPQNKRPPRGVRSGREGKKVEAEPPASVAQLAGIAAASVGVGRPITTGERANRLKDTIQRAHSDPNLLDARIPLAMGRQIVEELVDPDDEEVRAVQMRMFKILFDPSNEDQRRAALRTLKAMSLDKIHDHTTATVQVAKQMQDAQIALEVVGPAVAVFGREVLERLSSDPRVPPNVVRDLEHYMRARAQTLLVQVAAGKEFKP